MERQRHRERERDIYIKSLLQERERERTSLENKFLYRGMRRSLSGFR
jgi:hypothetical protein